MENITNRWINLQFSAILIQIMEVADVFDA